MHDSGRVQVRQTKVQREVALNQIENAPLCLETFYARCRPAPRNSNSAKRVQPLPHLCVCESFRAGREGSLDQFQPRNTLSCNRGRPETRIVRLRAAGGSDHASTLQRCSQSRPAHVPFPRFPPVHSHRPEFPSIYPPSCWPLPLTSHAHSEEAITRPLYGELRKTSLCKVMYQMRLRTRARCPNLLHGSRGSRADK